VCARPALALDVARLETRKAETGHRPTIDLQASYNIQHNPNGTVTAPQLNTRTNNATVGVALNLPLFAGFAVQNRVKETLALEQKAEADLETARRNVAGHTQRLLWRAVGQGQVKALEAAEQSSQSALDANKLGYQVGVRINIDVLNARASSSRPSATWPRPATTCCWAPQTAPGSRHAPGASPAPVRYVAPPRDAHG
jgi:outer membrane protein